MSSSLGSDAIETDSDVTASGRAISNSGGASATAVSPSTCSIVSDESAGVEGTAGAASVERVRRPRRGGGADDGVAPLASAACERVGRLAITQSPNKATQPHTPVVAKPFNV